MKTKSKLKYICRQALKVTLATGMTVSMFPMRGMAAYAYHAMVLGYTDDTVNAFFIVPFSCQSIFVRRECPEFPCLTYTTTGKCGFVGGK